MAHYAQIENHRVTQVVVSNVTPQMPGVWVQTSYNTRGGIHYGPDGQPDGGVALRMNYAGVGYTYDAVRDAFYEPQPSAYHRLNPTTCLWELKPEYTLHATVKTVSAAAALPVGVAGSPILVNGVQVTNGGLVLFTALPSNAGVYLYNAVPGRFTKQTSLVPWGLVYAPNGTWRQLADGWTNV